MPRGRTPKDPPIDRLVMISNDGTVTPPRPSLRRKGAQQADSIRWTAEGRKYYVVFGVWPFDTAIHAGYQSVPDITLTVSGIPKRPNKKLYVVEVPVTGHSKKFLGALPGGQFTPYGYLPASLFEPGPQTRQAGPEVLGEEPAPDPVPVPSPPKGRNAKKK